MTAWHQGERQTRNALGVWLVVGVVVTVSACASLPSLEEHALTPSAAATVHDPTGAGLSTSSERSAAFLADYTRLVARISRSAWVPGNRVTLYTESPATLDAMLAAIDRATDTVHVETFSIADDASGRRIAEALLRKQADGVQVQFLYDSVGSFPTPAALFEWLRDGGIQVREFNPLNPLEGHGAAEDVTRRDHRRILLIDGTTAFTGSSNLSNLYASSPWRAPDETGDLPVDAWRDTDVQITGPAVAEFQMLFLESWAQARGPASARTLFPPLPPAGDAVVQVLGSTPSHRHTFLMYLAAFTCARQSIHLTTPYLVPDAQLLTALTDAAGRGVDVKILLPGHSDSAVIFQAGRRQYTALLEAGVQLYERGTAAILHAKTAVVDGIWSTVGSTNLDFWSLLHNDELNVVIRGADFAAQLDAAFAADLQASRQIRLDEWLQRPVTDRVTEWLAHLLARWL